MAESVTQKQPKKLLNKGSLKYPFPNTEESARDLASNSPWERYKYWLTCLKRSRLAGGRTHQSALSWILFHRLLVMISMHEGMAKKKKKEPPVPPVHQQQRTNICTPAALCRMKLALLLT